MKIIRVNNEIHSAFKKMCQVNKVTITQGTEKLIAGALKTGTFSEVKENVFKKIQELENTFRSWMKHQEKNHLDRITEDMISLSRNLNDLGTKTDMYNAIKDSQSEASRMFKSLIEKYQNFEDHHKKIKERMMDVLYYLGKSFVYSAIIVFVALIIKSWLPTKEEKIIKMKLWEVKYEYLYDYCERFEKKWKVEFLEGYDAWLDTSEVLLVKQLESKGYVHQNN